ncbi:Hsp70 family protein [Aurantiacibacter gangjinensis]|uniref:2-alkenal reductase n=1 Tax=Aurantiacibacter gangjinensis TaxID=502682 RepID=A0A0G9MT85_9SPHN|nr:molecular chaperone HscC [Aurantiacibacter gangjinensis]APE28282.1 Chaperone protein DnaK [Aurantiacibacter gangjinensis]KLE32523.1 2-alkenal reductase [Aurantiacibacter gangjinensis]
MLIGIDLGTTNSAVAIWREGEAQLIENALGKVLTPSAVSVDESGQSWVGAAALDRLATHPAQTATSFKRFIGTERSTALGAKRSSWKAEDLSAMVLRALADDIEARFGERPTEAVITVPAYFNDKQRKATRRAGELAGLDVRRLINEPTAAALAFGLQDRGDREPFLVFDLGGGTFDVSIVEMFDGIVEVRASAGDNRLGGDDFNAALVKLARPKLGDDANDALEALPSDRRNALLELAAEKTRRALSESGEVEFSVMVNGKAFTAPITAEEFETACDPLIKRLREPVVRAMRDCGIASDELSDIVLVGGATRMPVVKKAITRMFGRFPNANIHPDHAVALGAAVQAGLLSKGEGLEEIRISDVAPFTMGIAAADRDRTGRIHDGLFSPIIQRNTPVPVSREHSYSTMHAGQRHVDLKVYQGEARLVKDNVLLGELSIPMPKGPEGMEVRVRFTYDSSGLLEVDAFVPESGLTKNLVIADEEDRRDSKEFAKRRKELEKLKVHPREDQENIALMARAERMYESHSGMMRDHIGQLILQFESVIEAQDQRAIAEAREQFSAALDQLDGASPL